MNRALIAACLLVITAAAPARTLNGFVLDDALVPAAQIKSGGPSRDGIPALFAPNFIAANAADFLRPDDRVLGVTLNGIAKAYPIRILNYHEVVNDRFKGTPVAVTFCPLCGSGVVFHAEAGGQVRAFGVSGLLYNSDVLMYDRQSESLWSQLMGQAISGPAKGTRLTPLPVRHTTWRDWRGRHPDTVVLKPPRAYGRNYNVDPYLGYADSDRIWFPVAHRDRRSRSTEVVLRQGLPVYRTTRGAATHH